MADSERDKAAGAARAIRQYGRVIAQAGDVTLIAWVGPRPDAPVAATPVEQVAMLVSTRSAPDAPEVEVLAANLTAREMDTLAMGFTIWYVKAVEAGKV